LVARAGRNLLCERDDLRRVAIDEDARGEILSRIHRGFFPGSSHFYSGALRRPLSLVKERGERAIILGA
jgi:hypothetical protein